MLISKKIFSWEYLVGHPFFFTLEERIFNAVTLFAIFTTTLATPFNFIIGLIVPTYISIFLLITSSLLFYLSRVKRKCALSIILFCITGSLCFTVNYFFNSGINGPNISLFIILLILTVTIIPQKKVLPWIILNLILALGILILEYNYPNAILEVYDDRLSKVYDFILTYFIIAALVYFTINYLKTNYEQEKTKVLKNNAAIAEQNAKILTQKQELELVNTEKDKLFSIVSHDIRGPLASIQGYLEMLTASDLSNEEKLYLEKELLHLTKNTSEMLVNILSWSKTQMEGANAILQTLNLNIVLENWLKTEKSVALKKDISIAVTIEEDINLLADLDMLQLVLRNLVNNAIKFTHAGGKIIVNAIKKNNLCYIAVQDNGIGIDTAQVQNLFKLKAATTYGTNNEKGVGLGLLLCKEYIELQNGEIWFESESDKGTIFTISLPLI